MEELLKKAESGDLDAMYQLGRGYQFAEFAETDGKPDYEAAYQWYYKAAQSKHQEAMISLGDALTLGRGCQRDPDMGAMWYQEAYELGKETRLHR